MKMIVLSLLVAFGATSFAQQNQEPTVMPPSALLGDYTLKSGADQGCENKLHVYPAQRVGADQTLRSLFVGPYFFEAINQGPQRFESELTVSRSESFTTANNELIRHGSLTTKFDGQTTLTHTHVTLVRETLTINSEITIADLGSSSTTCVYELNPQ